MLAQRLVWTYRDNLLERNGAVSLVYRLHPTSIASPDMKQHGPWQIVKQHLVHSDPWTRVRQDDVIRPDGQLGTYTVIDLKPGVSVLAADDRDNVYLTEEFHYGVGCVTIETVSGGIEADEDALTTAQRELQEELGIEAASGSTWEFVTRSQPTSSRPRDCSWPASSRLAIRRRKALSRSAV